MKIIFTLCLSAMIGMLAGCSGNSKETSATNANIPAASVTADPMKNKGVGPVKTVSLPSAIDQNMAAEGKKIYEEMCSACHKADQKFIGPAPKGILERRTPEWIMNMILNPEVMIQQDPIAKQLLMEYNGAPMANQNLTQDQARKILEYFRTL